MSDERERTPSELLKRRILGDTGDQLATAGKAMFDLFTGGSDAVLDSIAEDFEAKKRGEAGSAMRPRYRCTACSGVHNEGTGCDTDLDEHAPPPLHRADVVADTERAPPLVLEAPRILVCAACLKDDEDAKPSRFGVPLDDCERCHEEQPKNSRAFAVRP